MWLSPLVSSVVICRTHCLDACILKCMFEDKRWKTIGKKDPENAKNSNWHYSIFFNFFPWKILLLEFSTVFDFHCCNQSEAANELFLHHFEKIIKIGEFSSVVDLSHCSKSSEKLRERERERENTENSIVEKWAKIKREKSSFSCVHDAHKS